MISKLEWAAGLLMVSGGIGAFTGFVNDSGILMGVGILMVAVGFALNTKD